MSKRTFGFGRGTVQESNSIWSRFKKEDLKAGISVGFVRSLGIGISLLGVTSIVFAGGLEPFIRSGTEIWFLGSAILCVILALTSKFESPLATTPLPVVVVLVAIAQSIDLAGFELFITFVFVLFLSAIFSGIMFLLVGSMKLANVFRFVPFSVSAGALTGAGLLIALLAVKLVGFEWTLEFWGSLQEPVALARVLSCLVLFALFLIANKFWGSFWTMPVIFLLFCAAFHLCLFVLGISLDEATSAGFFVTTDWSSRGWPFYELSNVQAVNWMAVVSQIPNVLTLFFVLLVLTAVGYAQLEITTKKEYDWNSEFRLHGIANIASGIGGGIPGGMVASMSIPNIALKANTPINSFVVAIVMVLFVIFGIDLLRFVPLAAPAGYLLFIAYLLVNEWLLRSRGRLQFPDYCMLLLIAVTIVLVGFLEGIVLGLVLSLVFFAYRLSQVPLVEASYSIRDKRSPQARSIPDQSILRVYGLRAQIYQLRGYAFFGSAFALASRLNRGLKSDPHPVCVVLDFSRVTGFDLSALDSLRGYIRNANAERVTTIVGMASEETRRELERDLTESVRDNLVWSDDEESALAHAEELVLEFYNQDAARDPTIRDLVLRSTSEDLTEYLNRQVTFEDLAEALSTTCDTLEFSDQDPIASADEPQKGLQLLVAGRASVKDSEGRVLYQCEPGAVIEQGSVLDQRDASLTTVAEGPCRTVLVTPEQLALLDTENQSLAMSLYRHLVAWNSRSDAVA